MRRGVNRSACVEQSGFGTSTGECAADAELSAAKFRTSSAESAQLCAASAGISTACAAEFCAPTEHGTAASQSSFAAAKF
jgi:hypothetical protein